MVGSPDPFAIALPSCLILARPRSRKHIFYIRTLHNRISKSGSLICRERGINGGINGRFR